MYNNTFHLIPAIDIIDGQCVRLFQGNYAQKTTYNSDPVAVAKQWAKQGADIIHLVDLDGAKAGFPVNTEVIKQIVKAVDIPVEFGGGIRTLEAVQELLKLGIQRVILGSIAAENPTLLKDILDKTDPERIIVGIDIKDGKPAIRGWLETVDIDLQSFIEQQIALGVKRVILTDISKDGAMQGPNLKLYQEICQKVHIPIVASGGVTVADDIKLLSAINNVEGCIIGKALYEGTIKLQDL